VGSAEAATTIDRPADEVWAVAGEFGGLDGWMPGVDGCRVEGDTRILEVLGMQITERLVRRDDAARVLEYSITESPLGAESHLGRVEVHEQGDGSRVTWYVEVSPDHLTELLVGTYQQALDAMKAHVESQGG
jgi:carbon monoxide dehydrogenase subunit G